ncbi:MAG: SidJ-related pseudokinase [Deltaproteobacteria bacterium]|nr:SidJ-related pseudokinase [Deltaproteobacteria bacterium]
MQQVDPKGSSLQTHNLNRERMRLERTLAHEGLDFSAAYMAVNDLHALICTHPEIIRSETISALQGILEKPIHSAQTQSFFLYQAAANALVSVMVGAVEMPLAHKSISVLKTVAGNGWGNQHRATTEALGSLPLNIRGPRINGESVDRRPHVSWNNLLKKIPVSIRSKPEMVGRSLVAADDRSNRMLVIKLARTNDSLQHLNTEALWMEHLQLKAYPLPVRFDIPVPLKVDGSFVFRLSGLPVPLRRSGRLNIDSGCYGIGFIAGKDYFRYPNDHQKQRRLSSEEFKEVLLRNAWLLGKLTSLGIVHSAPIPLFHNRTQRHRRADNGIYEWPRGGRLDRWLNSCRYPNFGMSGLRDFEHFLSFPVACRNLYPYIGTHLLSLIMVSGSYFRNKEADRYGLGPDGLPVDARELFDESFFEELIRGIFFRYYKGFSGKAFHGEMPVDFNELACRMIDEMGVDRHMEEILRVAEQREMTDLSFRNFLADNGYSENGIEDLKRGARDITVHTGPHLGGFNQRISLPELIRFLAIAAALCVAGRYEEESALIPGVLPVC